MRIREHVQGLSTRMRTAVHLYRARRRTREVFGRRPKPPVIVAVILVVMISAVVYFFSVNPAPPEELLGIASESDTANLAPAAVPSSKVSPEEVSSETTPAPADQAQEEKPPKDVYPINTHISDEITLETLFGDERFDTTLPAACSSPIKDAKRDMENVYAYNLEAQEEFEEAEREYLREKEKVEKAHAQLIEKRRKLDAIRIGCIVEEDPFGDAFKAYVNGGEDKG